MTASGWHARRSDDVCAPRRARWVQRADAAPAVPLLSYFCSAEPQNGPASAHSSALSTPRPPPSAVPSSSCSSCSLTAFMIHFLLFVCIKCVLLARSLLLAVVCFVLSLSLFLPAAARSLARLRWPACDHHVVMAAGDCYASLGMLLWVRQNEASQEAPRLISLFLLAAQINTHKQTNARNRDFHSYQREL